MRMSSVRHLQTKAMHESLNREIRLQEVCRRSWRRFRCHCDGLKTFSEAGEDIMNDFQRL